MKQSDLDHLRRLLGWIRCEIGQGLAELQQTMIDVTEGLGHPKIGPEAEARLVETYRRAESIPLYVRAAVKALEKALAGSGRRGPAASGAGREGGTEEPRRTAETRASIGLDPGAGAGRESALDDVQIERGLAEIGVYVWGQRGEDWLAGAEYAARLLRSPVHKPGPMDTSPGHSAPVAHERAALADLLEYVDRNTCTHEDTHRGGAIWTICDGCGMKWADDEGGFVPHQDAPAVAAARAALASAPTADGWRLVPIEPTEAMEQAAADYLDACVKAWGLWRAMLDAAPSAPMASAPVAGEARPKPDTSEADASPIVLGGPYSDPEDLIAELARLVAECSRADAQAGREVQRHFIYPEVPERARRTLDACRSNDILQVVQKSAGGAGGLQPEQEG